MEHWEADSSSEASLRRRDGSPTTKGTCPQVHDPLVQEIIEEIQTWKHYDERKHKHENQTLDDWQASSLGQHACQESPWLFKKSFHTNLQTDQQFYKFSFKINFNCLNAMVKALPML